MAEELSEWQRTAERLRKPAPRAIGKAEKRAARETAYRKGAKEARRRDGFRCRVCGGNVGLETHHVVPRSLVGKKLRDTPANLVTLCAEDHALFTAHVLKIEGSLDANGPLRILRYDKDEGGFVVFRENA